MGLEISKLHVRRSIFINANPARVWEEFTSFERFAAWFGQGHILHECVLETGGRVELSVEIDGKSQTYGGEVLIFEPEREASFAINWYGASMAWPMPMLWTIRLTSLYDGTQVEIFHHGFERLGMAAADNLEGYESGWDLKHLKTLRAIVEA